METYVEPSAADQPQNVADSVGEDDLQRVLHDVPRGAFALCALAVALVLIFWLAIYFGVFLPRGPVS
ncbi:MAG TPA: cytochrome c oxidase subunit 2A [Steroidobacteraceae bacterium]|nr:cytochrome c oxidase subunit 2A [Steroidobacteraceae bacterium]